MSERYDSQHLEHLLARLADETATPEEIAALEEILAGDLNARRLYVHYFDLHNELSHRVRAGQLEQQSGRQVEADLTHDITLPTKPASTTRGFLRQFNTLSVYSSRKWKVAGLTICASLLLTVVIVTAVATRRPQRLDAASELAQRNAGDGGREPDSTINPTRANIDQPSAPVPVARLTKMANCRWAHEARTLAIGEKLAAGRLLKMEAGVAEIEFDIGAKIIAQSPATLRLVSPKSIQLDVGKVTVEIKDERAHGFKILTPDASFVDQGTEFGVEVAPGGDSKIHVFRGMVDVDRKGRKGQPAPQTQRLLANVGARIESGADGMVLVDDTGECFVRSMDDAGRNKHVVAYWRFEDRPLGVVLPDTRHNTRPFLATADSSYNGNDMFTYSTQQCPQFSGDVPAATMPQTGAVNRSCLDNTAPPSNNAPTRDVYSHSQFSYASPIDLQTVEPAEWTIEASVKVKTLAIRRQTFVVRDGEYAPDGAQLAFRINERSRFELVYKDVRHKSHRAVVDARVLANQWYNLAAVSDGASLKLYVDSCDGKGYRLSATTDLKPDGPRSTALACSGPDSEWSVGRGCGPSEWFRGWIDEVRISDIALKPRDFLFSPRNQEKQTKLEIAAPARPPIVAAREP
jgi:hypothetical protein